MSRLDPRHYILDADNRPVPVDLMTWAKWFETADRRVAYTEINSEMFVSTVFISINHRFMGDGPPLLFETMVFKHKDDLSEDEVCWRYSSWDDAVTGHAMVVKRLRAKQGITNAC